MAVISSHSIKTLEVSQSCAGSTGESMLHTGIKIITMYIKKISFALQLDSVSVASFSRVNIQFF